VKTAIHFSAEWFAKVDEFSVLDGGWFVGQSTGDSALVNLTQELDDVLNFAFGLEHVFSERLAAYAGFTADYAANSEKTFSGLSVTDFDIYHVTLGTSFKVGTSELTLGLGYAFGSEKVGTPTNFTDTNESNDFRSAVGDSDLRYRTYKVVFGIIL
jgi:long-subunit fatty acid transport protein